LNVTHDLCPRAGVLVECPEILLDKPLPSGFDSRRGHLQRGGNLFITKAFVGLEQNTSTGELACPSLPEPKESF
jgi:hypothetical protein